MKPIDSFENYGITEAGQVINLKTGRVLKLSLNENGYLYAALWKNGRGFSRTVHRLVAEAFIPNPENKPFVNHLDANRTNPHRTNLEWCTQSENIQHAYNLGNMSQKRNFSRDELDVLLTHVISGTANMTEQAQRHGVGLSRLTINLRNHAHRTNQVDAFEAQLKEQKRIRNTEANTTRRRAITQLTLAGEVLASYPSLTAAAAALGATSSGSIHNALNPLNGQKTAYGYQWKYA